jgi:hypothetical protein|tara:strand:- start:268 stop:408 length:141 start_codon:yes stop_codon:yes gene_type:complete
MRLLIEVEGDEAVEVMEEFRVLIKKLEDLSDELTELREQLNADQAL